MQGRTGRGDGLLIAMLCMISALLGAGVVAAYFATLPEPPAQLVETESTELNQQIATLKKQLASKMKEFDTEKSALQASSRQEIDSLQLQLEQFTKQDTVKHDIPTVTTDPTPEVKADSRQSGPILTIIASYESEVNAIIGDETLTSVLKKNTLDSLTANTKKELVDTKDSLVCKIVDVGEPSKKSKGRSLTPIQIIGPSAVLGGEPLEIELWLDDAILNSLRKSQIVRFEGFVTSEIFKESLGHLRLYANWNSYNDRSSNEAFAFPFAVTKLVIDDSEEARNQFELEQRVPLADVKGLDIDRKSGMFTVGKAVAIPGFVEPASNPFGYITIGINVTNETPEAIKDVECIVSRKDPNRAIAHAETKQMATLRGGIEPGETKTIQLHASLASLALPGPLPPESLPDGTIIFVSLNGEEPFQVPYRYILRTDPNLQFLFGR